MPLYITLMISDITEQKRKEAELRSSGDRLRRLAAREEAVREEERTRIAREIHDDLGQALTILKLDLSWIVNKTPVLQRSSRSKLTAMMKQLDDAIDRVRTISSTLRPSILDDLGLVAAIEWQLVQLKKHTKIGYRFDAANLHVELPADVRIALFRVIQEALTNIMRHSGATSVLVSLSEKQSVLTVEIKDNGSGATAAQLNDTQNLGIVGMKERIMRIGGHLQIQSSPATGTLVTIQLPEKGLLPL